MGTFANLPEYKNHIIRWGKEEAEEAVVNKK
jgi:hypothetical protein